MRDRSVESKRNWRTGYGFASCIDSGDRQRLIGVVALLEATMRNQKRRGRADESKSILEDEGTLQILLESEMGSGEPGFEHR